MNKIINDASINEWFSQQMASLTPMKMVLALAMGFVVGLIIALVYRKAFRGVLYSPSFATTLIMLCMITTPVVMCIKSNIALSMGMVGALSIVRFRTAVKDPVDMVFIFWAIHIGITCGCQLYELAVLTSIIVTIVLVAMNHISFGTKSHILVVHTNDIEAQREVEAVVGKHCTKYRMKSRNYTDNGVNLVFEIITKEASELAEKITKVNSVSRFSLMEYEPDDIF